MGDGLEFPPGQHLFRVGGPVDHILGRAREWQAVRHKQISAGYMHAPDSQEKLSMIVTSKR